MGESESGDKYGPFPYRNKPTEEQLTKLVKMLDYDDGDGPGYAGSYVYITCGEFEFED